MCVVYFFYKLEGMVMVVRNEVFKSSCVSSSEICNDNKILVVEFPLLIFYLFLACKL